MNHRGLHQGYTLEDYEGTVSSSDRTITNFRFAYEIDGLAGEEEELAKLDERLDRASTAYCMGISAERSKLMTNNTSGINKEIKVNGQKIETVTSLKYLGAVVFDEGSKPDILSRIARTTAALTRLGAFLSGSRHNCHIHLPVCL